MARRRQFVTSGARRRTGWDIGPGSSTLQTVTASGSIIVGLGSETVLDGITIVRIRGLLRLVLLAGGAAEGFIGAFGICIVSSDAFAVGITAIPSPVDDTDWNGWMWHQYFSLTLSAAFQATGAGPHSVDLPIDSKAMRKTGVNNVITLIGEFTEIGTSSMTISADSRVLAKLP